MENIYETLRAIGLKLATINDSTSLLKEAAKAVQDLINAQEAYALILDKNGRFQLIYSNAPTPKSIETLHAEIDRNNCDDNCTTTCFSIGGHVYIRLSVNHSLYLITHECSPKQHNMLELFQEQTALQLHGILQHEQTAADLRNSQGSYQNLLHILREGIWMIDAEAKTTFVNAQMAKMLGYTIEEMMGTHLHTFMDEEEVQQANLYLARRKQGIKEQHPFTFLNKTGQPVYTLMESSPIIENGEYSGAIAGVMDVTERERIVATLRYSEKRFRDLVGTTNDWIWEIDAAGVYTYSNKAVTNLLGYTPEKIRGTIIFDLMLPKEAARVSKQLADIMAKKASFTHLRHVNKHENGSLVPLLSAGVPIIDAKGNLLGYRGIDRDITFLVEQEKAQIRTKQETELLLSILRAIGLARDFDASLELALRLISKHTHWLYGESWVINPDQGEISCHTQYIAPTHAARLDSFCRTSRQTSFIPPKGIPGRVWVTQKPAWYENLQALPAGTYLRLKAANKVGLTAALAVPAVVDGETVAVLMFYTDRKQERKSTEMQLITTVVSQLGIVLQQKQTQESLRKLSRAVEQSMASIFITNLDGIIEFVNPAFTEISGYSAYEAIGKTPSLLRGKHTPATVHQALWEAVQTGGSWEGDLENKCKDGSLVWLHSVISTIKDGRGNATHYLCIQSDVTAERAATMALRASEATNNALISAMPDIMFLVDNKGVIVANYGTENGLAMPPDLFINKNIGDIMSAAFSEPTFIAIEAALRTGKTQQFNYALSSDDGLPTNQYDVRLAVVDDNALLIIVRDVTIQMKAERALLESERRLAKAQELAHLGSWDWDIPSGTLLWSDETYRILGYQPQSFEPTYEKFLELLHPEDVDVVKTAVINSLNTQKLYQIEHRVKRPSGEIRYVQEQGELFYDKNNEPIRMVGAILDITEQTISLQKLKEATTLAQELQLEAERANRAKSMFLTNMSHELRTPLNGILGYTQLFKQDDTLSAQQLHGIDVIQRSGEHLLAMINDILDLAKIEAEKMTLTVSPSHLPDLLTSLVQMVTQLATQKGISFSHHLAAGLPKMVMTDEIRLRQVLLNLLSNAVKFTDRGAILLEVMPIETAVFSPTTTTIRFRVEDSGIGIAPELLDTIFSPFEQVSTAKDNIDGTGLGLAISQRLTSLLGGTLKVSSRLGQGSIFWFDLELPIVRTSESESEESTLSIPPFSGVQGDENMRLLIVDDIKSNRQVLNTYFSALSGFEIMEAHDGKDAVTKAKAFKPHLILMDLRMPVMDGVEATRQIRLLPALKKSIIIAVSASACVNITEEMAKARFNGFLVKPIQLAQLSKQIKMFSDGKWKWLYHQQRTEAVMAETAVIIPLPEAETAVLLELTINGDIKNIRDTLSTLKQQLNPQYLPIIDQLTQLSRQYRIRQMRELLEKKA